MNDEPKRETAAPSSKEPALRRTIGPAQMALYGLGSMLGAGIYGLVGKAAGQTGNALWLAFVVALIAALLTALSYARSARGIHAPPAPPMSPAVPMATHC